MADFQYEIVEELGVLSTSAKGWTKELNYGWWYSCDHIASKHI